MIARCATAPNPAPGELLSGGRNRTKARVFASVWRGGPAVVKSVAHQPAWLRWAAGVRALDREERAYRRLEGVRGVPRLLARPDPHSLVCERVEGLRLDEHPRRSLPAALFDALAGVVRQAHARGVAHGDLHRRDVIVDGEGAPWVVDWATSLLREGAGGALRAALFRRWAEVDLRAVEKLRRRYAAAGGPGSDRLPPEWAPHRWIWRLRRGTRRSAEAEGGISREAARATPRSAPLVGEGGPDPAPPRRSRFWGRVRLGAIYAGAAVLVWQARPTPVWILAGLALVVPGEAVRLWAAGHLLKSKELVTSGPYAYTQNPLYLGRLLILSGLALMCPVPGGLNGIALAIGLAVFFGYYLPRKLRVEGARLEGKHGERWREYRRSVPILFPALRPYPDAERRAWSWERMVRNREYLMVLALAAVLAWLWTRI